MKNIFCFAISFMFFGCGVPFQPPPNTIDSWMKKKSSKKDVELALIACGYTNMVWDYNYPYPDDNIYSKKY